MESYALLLKVQCTVKSSDFVVKLENWRWRKFSWRNGKGPKGFSYAHSNTGSSYTGFDRYISNQQRDYYGYVSQSFERYVKKFTCSVIIMEVLDLQRNVMITQRKNRQPYLGHLFCKYMCDWQGVWTSSERSL